jgi:hypothetical protein
LAVSIAENSNNRSTKRKCFAEEIVKLEVKGDRLLFYLLPHLA